MAEALTFIAGTLYGFAIGLIPSAGATTGLIAAFPLVGRFHSDPYLGVIFVVATVASSTIGDTVASVLLGIPGANSAAATIVDGFPLALQGRAAYALSAAFTTSTLNGVLWGLLTFPLLPVWTRLILVLGIPEMLALTLLAFVTVALVANRHWMRSMSAIAFGIWLGLIGYDAAARPRWTGGWDYLNDGVQLIPVVAGLFAIPELVAGWSRRAATSRATHRHDRSQQRREGIEAVIANWKLALRGGVVGAFIGALPGLGGAVADWMAYSQAVAANPGERFGNGNIKGVIGCEGANNAQKATSFIPTVLFGIPGAPFAAVMMAMFSLLNFDLGSLALAQDGRFFLTMGATFLAATLVTGGLCLWASGPLSVLSQVPYKYYFPVVLALVVWACMQYTGGYEDLVMLVLMSGVGLFAKRFKFSRPSILIAFILADRVEKLAWQTFAIYSPTGLLTRPIFLALCGGMLAMVYYAWRTRARIDYA
jgi:putative tricarboxylic transport membrane protein